MLKFLAPALLTAAVGFWVPGGLDAAARQAADIAQANEDPAPAIEAEPAETPEEAAENALLEKADVAAAIGYIEAHLRAAKEVGEAGNAADSAALLARARDSLGPEMAESLSEAGVPPLTGIVGATESGGAAAIDAAIAALAEARAGVAAGVSDATRYQVKVAVNLLYFALDQYRVWLNDPTAETAPDYESARGLVGLAKATFEQARAEVAARSGQAANGIAGTIGAIMAGFPSATPPAKPKLLEGDMTAQVNAANELSEGF